MNKLYSIDKETIEKCLSEGAYETLSELNVAREEYFNSDVFLKNRRILIIRPSKFGLPKRKLSLLSVSELVVKEIMYEFNKVVEDMPKHLHDKLENAYIETGKVFPPPIDVYISHSEASQIFGVSVNRLHISRKIGVIKTIQHEGEFTYHWAHLQAFFG